MTNEEIYLKYLEQEKADEGLQFIAKLSKSERKDLRPFLIKIAKEYTIHDYVEGEGRKASNIQNEMLHEAGAICLTKKEYQKIFWSWYFRFYDGVKTFKRVMDVERIEWLAKNVEEENRYAYIDRMALSKAGYIMAPLEELIEALSTNITDTSGNDPKYQPEILEVYPETLSEHIWKLFEYETTINWTDGRYRTKEPWKNAFKNLTNSKKLDRKKVLEECLLTANRNFNKVLTGWFFDLFLFLEPTEKELMELQPALMNALTSPQSKVVNGVLKIFKKLAVDPKFKLQDLLDYGNVLLASETKSVVNSTLMILDKIATKQKSRKSEISLLSCSAFGSSHKDIQLRAAKLILKHGDKKEDALTTEVSSYSNNLLSDTKKLLSEFLTQVEEDIVEENIEYEAINVLTADRLIPVLETLEDFIFLASQVFDNNEPYHLEQFLDGIIQFKAEFKKESFIEKIAPAFQRAYKTVLGNLRANQGFIDWSLGLFVLDFSHLLVRLYPNATGALQKLYAAELKKDLSRINRWSEKKETKSRLTEGFKVHWHDKNPYKEVFTWKMNLVLEHFESGELHSFLSRPTHALYWIEPSILIHRIKNKLAHQEAIEAKDLCLAIARLALHNPAKSIQLAKNNLSGDYQQLMLFALGEVTTLPKTKLSIDFFAQAYLNNPKGYTYFKELDQIAEINLMIGKLKPRMEKSDRGKWWHLRLVYDKSKTTNESIFVTQKTIQIETAMDADLKRVFSLAPNNPESLFSAILSSILYIDWVEAENGRMLERMGEILFEIITPIKDAGYLFLASTFASENKTIRSFSAEFWIKEVAGSRIDNEMLGQFLGTIQSVEFCPIKRFTDLAKTQMTNISKHHDAELQTLILSAIPNMADKPIRNTKQLLEILLELKIKNNTKKLSIEVIAKLDAWKASGSLKKVIKELTA